MFDPGTYETLASSCDINPAIGASDVLANWLASNPDNRLVIPAGEETADYENAPDREHAHRGIQDIYFPSISGRPIAAQVTVCNIENDGVLGVTMTSCLATPT